MKAAHLIVLDANILIRYVLGEKVPALLAAYSASVDFLAPDTAYAEARQHWHASACETSTTGPSWLAPCC